jgi:KDO2-lipid IV(A) lauroyltransferase
VIEPPLECVREGRLRDDVVRVTESLTRRIEDLIRKAPEQWHMFQPNWPSDASPKSS